MAKSAAAQPQHFGRLPGFMPTRQSGLARLNGESMTKGLSQVPTASWLSLNRSQAKISLRLRFAKATAMSIASSPNRSLYSTALLRYGVFATSASSFVNQSPAFAAVK